MSLELTDDGLSTQTQQEIADELAAKLRSKFGANLKTGAKSIMGQIINIVAELRAIDQQALLSVYESFDPSGARGRALDARLTLTGSTRLGATNSYVDGLLEFGSAGTMNNGDLIRNTDNDTLWQLIDGPHTATGPYPEYIAARFQAVDTGEILANAGTTWALVTIVSGLTGFTNATDDAEVGRSQEQDGDARTRRLIELYSQGQGPLATIQGVVSKVDGVIFCRVYHNPTDSPTDSNGIPFKAFNVVVETNPSVPTAAQQQAIYDAIWSAMGAGGQAYGTSYSGTTIDTENVAHAIAFDLVSLVDAVINIDLVTSTSENPITPNLNAVVAAEVLAEAQANHEIVGRDVLALDYAGIVASMIADGTISGVDAANVTVGPSGGPYSSKFAMGIRQRADFDSTNVIVSQS